MVGTPPKAKTATNDDGVQVTAGSSVVEIDGVRSLAVLTVYTGFGRSAAVLAIANDRIYEDQMVSFLATVKLVEKALSGPNSGKVPAPAPESQPGQTSKKTIDDQVKSAGTNVGTPNGQSVTKSIGPEGGSIASPDGRMTLKIPPNIVPTPVRFSIQPITNQAQGGLGNAYRLEPNGQTFAKPVELSIKYTDEDLRGTALEVLTLAYQDDQKVWHGQKVSKLDKAAKMLTISTTHFSDWSFLSKIFISPVTATIHVGESVRIVEDMSCVPGGGQNDCSTPAPSSFHWSLAGFGSIREDGHARIYTAPAKVESTNVALVKLDLDFEQADDKGRPETMHLTLTAVITIIGNAYKVVDHAVETGMPFLRTNGVACDPEKIPFTIEMVAGEGMMGTIPFDIKFDPSTGTASYDVTIVDYPKGSGSGITANWKAAGTYLISGAGTDKVTLYWTQTSSTMTLTHSDPRVPMPPPQVQKMKTIAFDLVPFESDKCK